MTFPFRFFGSKSISKTQVQAVATPIEIIYENEQIPGRLKLQLGGP